MYNNDYFEDDNFLNESKNNDYDLKYVSRSPKNLLENKISTEIYPLIESSMKTNKSAYINCISRFVHQNHAQLYDYAPIDRIFFRQKEIDDYFKSIKLNEHDIEKNIMQNLFYYEEDELQACKDAFSLCQLMTVKYFMMVKDEKSAELSCMYLAFSGKFYASCHYKWFRKYVPKREVMDYVINYMLSKKFDIIVEKSLWGAIRNLVKTWMKSYESILLNKKATDEEHVYIIHQLYERIYAFLRNIAKPYFEAAEKKLYLNAESDNYDSEGGKYRVVNNNSTAAASITERTMNYFTSSNVNVARCYSASSSGVDALDVKAIFETILNDNKSLDDLRELINILIVDFMKNYPNIKPDEIPTSVDFINYTIKAKPNTKDEKLIWIKTTILSWLNTSERYRNTKTPATKNNYYRAILIYIALTINASHKE